MWTSDELDGSIDRLLEQLAGAPSTDVDVRSVRRRARKVRRIRLVRNLGAVTVAVTAAVALSQSMIGGTAQQGEGDVSANDVAPHPADVQLATDATPTTVARASAAPATPATRRGLPDQSSRMAGPVLLVPSATAGTTWARDQAYDHLVVSPDDATTDGTDAPARAARRVSSW